MYIYSDEKIPHPDTFGRQQTIVVNENYRIWRWERISLPPPSLLLQRGVGIRENRSLLAM